MAAASRTWAWAFGAFLLSSAPLAAAQAPDNIDPSTIETMSAQILAERLLGPERAANVASFQADRDPLLGVIGSLRFFHRARPLAPDICSRAVDHLSLTPAGPVDPQADRSRAPLRVGATRQFVEIAHAPECRLATGQPFVRINPNVPTGAATSILRNLAAAQAAAQANGGPPFLLSCEDELNRGCADEGRTTLAALRVEQAWLIQDGNSVIVGEPGQAGWTVRFVHFGESGAEVRLSRRIPASY
jgi:hypothetical protein